MKSELTPSDPLGQTRSEKNGLKNDWPDAEAVSPKEHAAVERLLQIFANHRPEFSSQIDVQQTNAEPTMITRAREFIKGHHGETLSLARVAKAVNASPFYFCKMFKKGMGVNFTVYVSRVRIESAIDLLADPRLRINEIAYQVGFQSLTHFNRVFKKMMGQSPTDYRAKPRQG